MKKAICILIGGFLLAACDGAGDQNSSKVVDPALQARADNFVKACAGAAENFGSKVLRPECECIAASVVEYINPESALKFFDDLTPLYEIEDDKRREDSQDRYWRDLIIGLSTEERPQWNAMLTEAFPVCRGEGEGDA
ncbi:MAG: hypothetical protein AAF936_00350 [Pseudomonadota bacterium]